MKFDDSPSDQPAPYSEFHANAGLYPTTYMFEIICKKCNGEKCEHCEWTGTEVLGVRLGKMNVTD